MFDIYWGDIELTTLVLIVSVVLILPAQTLLCFRAKSLSLRLLPVLTLSALAVVFLVLNFASSGWDGLGYVFLSLFCAMMVLACAAGWGVWALVPKTAKRRRS